MKEVLERISDTIWEIPISYKEGMRVPARIYGTEKLIEQMDEGVYDQVTNVAMLPGITKYALCMPDGHFGYGFPIGGVAAMDVEQGGVISPGGIGFDINCGMRLVVTNLTYSEVKPQIKKLVDKLYERVPAGVGSTGFVKLTRREFRTVIEQGAHWCIDNGFGWEEDLELMEENGCFQGADAAKISDKAIDRGINQIGTLGSGNHYLEVQVAKEEDIFDPEIAKTMGITMPDQVVIMFHCGSRGFGHQVATDYLQVFLKVILENEALDMLLFNFLQEFIYYKDSEQLLLRAKQVQIEEKQANYYLQAITEGEKLDSGRHHQRVDVKAVTLHRFQLEKTSDGWTAIVLLDI